MDFYCILPRWFLRTLVFAIGLHNTASALIVTSYPVEVLEHEHFTSDVLRLAKSPGYIGWSEGPPFGGGNYCLDFEGDAVALGDFMTSFTKLVESGTVTFTTAPLTTGRLVNREDVGGSGGTYAHWTLSLWTQRGWEKQIHAPEDMREPETQPGKDGLERRKAPPPALTVRVLPAEN